ncbi:MAG: nitroreductase family protein [Bacteroidales bacterium]|nr:nitroreductase family protein [Bacteroidales bacterium]
MSNNIPENSFHDLVLKNRSYRRFDASIPVSEQILFDLLELVRLTPSSKNRQPLKYILINNQDDCNFVFSHLKWAWFLRNWDGPSPEERPTAYLIMLLDKNLNDKADFDAGIAAQTILLGAVEKDFGGCIIRTFNRYELAKYFCLPENFDIIMVIALGKPAEEIIIDNNGSSGKMEYFRDENGLHHVPKRTVNELIYSPIRHDQD